jgi:hypothetical protein
MFVAKFRFAQWLWDWLLALHDFSFEWDKGNVTKNFQRHGSLVRKQRRFSRSVGSFHSENSTIHLARNHDLVFWGKRIRGDCYFWSLLCATREFE